jgi:6,7-dimethyl-8-ribityllumazine synthase
MSEGRVAPTVGVIVSRWNELITKALLEGALETLAAHGVEDPIVAHVPGAWEIPVAAKAMIEGHRPDAVVALGCILQGETSHAGMLAGDVGSALMRLQVETGTPIAWGVLTPENAQQALDRAGLKHGNKGREAADAAVEMAHVVRGLRNGQ